MRRITLALLFPLLLLLAGATLAWAAPPVIQQVFVDRGLDLDAPGWPSYHQRVVVTVSDADGAGDIWCAEIIDPTGAVDRTQACYQTFDGKGWWQVDDFTIALLWSQSSLSEPTPSGSYTITVYGLDTGEEEGQDTLTTAVAPAVSGTCPEALSPLMDSVISDTTPTFEWAVADPGAFTRLEVEEEGTYGVIWSVDLDSTQTSADYDFDDTASQTPLQPNHSCFWTVGSWYPHEDPDPRVSIWTANQVHGRFTEYGPYPEVLPDLPGKLAYTSLFTPGWAAASHSAIMQYNPDPWVRIALGPDHSDYGDWSPDGSRLLYNAPGGLWIDTLDSTPASLIPGISGGDCRWAADGNRIVYSVGAPSPYLPEGWSHDIWVANIDGSNAYPLVDSLESDDRWPDWSPDGMWIVYRKIPHPMSTSVWLARYDGSEYRPVVPTTLVGHSDYQVMGMIDAAWSPDGQKLAVAFDASAPALPDIVGVGTISRDGGPVTPVFINPPGYDCCAGPHLPQWSPDGTKVVFSSGWHLLYDPDWAVGYDPVTGYGKFEPGVELWMVNADGTGDPVRLTYDHSFDYYATWWAPNTEPGSDVEVVKGDTTVTFADVTETGNTSVTVFNDPPASEPQGFTFLGDYYDISTDAEISGTITIEIHYDGTGMTEEEEQWLSLLHWEGGETGCWVDITVRPIDTANDIIRGECTSLSAFGVASGYQFVGLLPPVNNDGSSVFKLRRTVPVKFQLTEPGGAYVSTADARLYVARISNNVTGTYEEAASTSQADSGNSFRYDPESDQYIFNLGTRGLTTGTWYLQVVVNEMVAKQVLFSLR